MKFEIISMERDEIQVPPEPGDTYYRYEAGRLRLQVQRPDGVVMHIDGPRARMLLDLLGY